MSTETPRPYRSVLPYLSMLLLTFGIVLLIFGGMIDGTGPRHYGSIKPLLSAVTIPVGIGLVVFGGMLRKQAKKDETLHQRSGSLSAKSCPRCKTGARSGAAFCRNCGQRL